MEIMYDLYPGDVTLAGPVQRGERKKSYKKPPENKTILSKNPY